jgi:hypothetical protein
MPGSLPATRASSLPRAGALTCAFMLAALALPAYAADVGVSISIGQPGYYGQINIGDVPQPPQVIYPTPVVIERDPHYAGPPLYLRVPVGYEKHWDKHCREYRACGRPFYFVRDDWYRNTLVPHYRHRDEVRAREEDHRRERDDGREHERHE